MDVYGGDGRHFHHQKVVDPDWLPPNVLTHMMENNKINLVVLVVNIQCSPVL